MTQILPQRRLTTVLIADLVGYSRLVSADEEGVIERLKNLRRDIIEPAVTRFGGRIVKTMGDGFLVEFSSPVSSVRCALSIQEGAAAFAADEKQERQLQFRIGIHLGDIVVDGEDILGDCVNVAARLETLAPAGGVVISGHVHDQIKGRIAAGMKWLGPQSVKNIPTPIDVWEVETTEPVDPRPKPNGPTRASIAVLPFQNISSDPDQEFLTDGLVEDVITELSRFRWLLVIARNSTFAYKNAPKDVRKIGQELGVRFLVEGSVRRSGERLRVTAQLIDTLSGAHIWAERWDRNLSDLFDVQDELTSLIVSRIEPELAAHERSIALTRPTESLTAWECCHRGHAELLTFDPRAQDSAEAMLRRSIELDPGFALPISLLARQRYYQVASGQAEDVDETVRDGVLLANRALSVDPRNDLALAIKSLLLTVAGEPSEALQAADKAIAINPSNALSHHARGMAAIRITEFDTAIEAEEAAIRLSPNDPATWAFNTVLACGLYARGRPEDRPLARKLLKRAMEFEHADLHPFLWQAIFDVVDGDQEAAKKAIVTLMSRLPDSTAHKAAMSSKPIFEVEPWKGYLGRLVELGLPRGQLGRD